MQPQSFHGGSLNKCTRPAWQTCQGGRSGEQRSPLGKLLPVLYTAWEGLRERGSRRKLDKWGRTAGECGCYWHRLQTQCHWSSQ
jgi:hypothetical protein